MNYVKRLKLDPNDSNLIFKINTKTFDEDIKIGFNIFFFIKIIDDNSTFYQKAISNLAGN